VTIKNVTKCTQGPERRRFMAEVVNALGPGSQRWAEQTLQWSRVTVRKGQRELDGRRVAVDRFDRCGRKRAEHHLPNLLDDISVVVKPHLAQDPTFRTVQVYRRVTAGTVRNALLERETYANGNVPSERTIRNKLNDLDFRVRRVAKSKPIKKIKQTDAIFEQLHKVNARADRGERVLRLSMDAKAAIKVGPFSRRGRNRTGECACDHDFAPDCVMQLFGIFVPQHDDIFFYFNESRVTADLEVDCLERAWPHLQDRYGPLDKLVINLDNGPENHSRRTWFLKRMVDFVHAFDVAVSLAYYPPYHSKYNPVERVWGITENHWRGEILDSREKVLELARSVKWNGRHPEVTTLPGDYPKGKRLDKKEMACYESQVERLDSLPRWFVDIRP